MINKNNKMLKELILKNNIGMEKEVANGPGFRKNQRLVHDLSIEGADYK